MSAFDAPHHLPPIFRATPRQQGAYQAVADAASEFLAPAGDMVASALPGSRTIYNTATQTYVYELLCQVMTAGPNGEDDYTDNRYWVQTVLAYQSYTDDQGDARADFRPDLTERTQWLTATNTPEATGSAGIDTASTAGGHGVPAGTVAWVRMIEGAMAGADTGAQSYPQFVMSVQVLPVRLKITGNAIPGGVYTARLWQNPASSLDILAATFTDSDLGTDPGSDNCYAVNTVEIGLTTHDLTNVANTRQKFFAGQYLGPASDGKPCYTILGLWEQC